MRIDVRLDDDVAILKLSGRFLAGTDGPDLRQKIRDLIEAGNRKLIIDLGDVPYVDSTGLGFLAGARVTAQNAGAQIVLASLNPDVRRVLHVVNLAQFFVIGENEAAAIASLRQAAVPPR